VLIKEGEPVGRLSKGIRGTLKAVAGLYLLLNLCVSTIPRCDSILNLLQHTIKSQGWATLVQHDEGGHSCHDIRTTAPQLSADKVCECSLVKFVFVTLPDFNPERFIGFQIQTTTLLSFDIARWNPAAHSGPEPPYPRSMLA
jgi:hypothetical protein